MIVVILAAVVFFLHLLLKLNWIMTGILFVILLLLVWRHKKKYHEMQRQQQRFFDTLLYMDTLLYSFVKEGKIDVAMEDVAAALSEGALKRTAQSALDHMRLTFDETAVMENSLAIVEKEYSCRRIRNIHAFMTHVEYYGGDMERSVNLLLEEKTHWEKRIREAIQERKKTMVDVILSVVVSLGICGMVMYLPVMDIDISRHPVTQILTVVVILLDDLIIQKAQNFLAPDWLKLEEAGEDEYYEKKMAAYKSYDRGRDLRLSAVLGAVSAALTALVFVLVGQWAGMAGIALTLLCMNQHRIGRRMAEKSLVQGINCAFPVWLMDLVLLLQSENVQMALQKSRESVPGVLREELEQLVARLEVNPESSEPYHCFLQDFDLPQIHSAMSMLYSLSVGSSHNADRQVGELISRNQEMMDHAQALRMRNKSGSMYGLFLAPVLTASLKLLADMAMFMMEFLSAQAF